MFYGHFPFFMLKYKVANILFMICYDPFCMNVQKELVRMKIFRRKIMAALKTALTVLFIIVCVILSVLILAQEGKDAGLGAMTGSTPSGTYWSQNKGRSRKARIVQITTAFTVLFFVLAAVLASKLF